MNSWNTYLNYRLGKGGSHKLQKWMFFNRIVKFAYLNNKNSKENGSLEIYLGKDASGRC